MTAATGMAAIVSLVTGTAVVLVCRVFFPPPSRLARRVRPYTVGSRTSLGRSADIGALAGSSLRGGTIQRLFGPLVTALAERLGELVDAASEEALRLKLRQANLLADVPEEARVQEYRVRQLGNAVAGAAVGGLVLAVAGASTALLLLGIGLGFVIGVTRWRTRVDRLIDQRRARMRIELYTVNQLLAINVRVGGGIIQAVRRVTERGQGEVIAELREALIAHETGMNAPEAFRRIATVTPEPNAARTYKLLATGAEWGSDLATGLRALSEDVRDARREALKRQATKRRAAMLIPIIAILAPVMLLFIAAPLPSLIFGAT